MFFHSFWGWKKPTHSGHQMFFSLSFFLSSKKKKWWLPNIFSLGLSGNTLGGHHMFFWGANIILLYFITR